MFEFYVDTQSHFETIEDDILQLEEDSSRKDLIDDVFRRVHSIKGNAGVLGLMELYTEGQEFETFLEGVRERKTATTGEIDMMLQGLDKLKIMIAELKGEELDPGAEEVVISKTPAPVPTAPSPPHVDEEYAQVLEPTGEIATPQPPDATDTKPFTMDEKAVKAIVKEPESMTFLTFRLDDERYGVDIMKVREIIVVEAITPVPNTLDFVCGVMNLRDQVLPVFDLRKRLEIPHTSEGKERNIIIIEIDKATTGLKVDEVVGIITITADKITPPEKFMGSVSTEFLQGMGNTEDDTIILLDIQEMCAANELLF